MSKKKKRNKKVNCFGCENCIPIGEGDHFCDVVMGLVISDYEPTENFNGCHKKGAKNGGIN